MLSIKSTKPLTDECVFIFVFLSIQSLLLLDANHFSFSFSNICFSIFFFFLGWIYQFQPKHVGNDMWDVAMERRDKKLVEQLSGASSN